MPLGRLLAVARTGSLAVSFLLLLGAASAGDDARARAPGRPAVEVTQAARHDASAPLWLLQRPDFTLEREKEEEENEHRVHRFRKLPPAALRATGAPDPVLQSEMPWIRMPAVGVTFDGVGQGFTGPGGTFSVTSSPPDTSGDVGPNHYIQVVNSGFAIFNKSGTTLFGPAPTNTLWSGFGGLCQTTNQGDAIVLYDALADRWFMTQFAFGSGGGNPVAPFFQCVAVSQTGDPTGAWYRYAYQYADFPDYGKFGVWPDGYYATFNMFAAGTLAWAGGNNCVYDRAAMLSGAPATQQCINLGTNYGGLLPADLDGTRLPPAGSPGYIMGFDITPNSHLQLWHFRVNWANPAATTLTMQPTIPVATINLACGNGGTCVPQAGTTNRLDSLGDRLMFRLAYRNFGTHDALVSNLTVNTAASSTANTGVRWFELRNPGTAPTLFQEGTYAPDAHYRWMGSIAQDGQGNMGLGFSLASSALSPSIRYTGRLVTDPLGQMAQGENTIIDGASQTGTLARWGDYSMMGVDPTDDCTFWYTTEYLAAAGSFNWRTRVGSFKFPGCPGVANDFGLTVSPRSAVLPVGASVSFTVTTSVKSGAAQSISLSTSGLPAGVTASFSPATVTAGGSSTLTLTAPVGTSAANNVAFNVVGTSPSVSRMAVATVSVQRNEFAMAIAPSARTITAGSSGTYTVSTAVSSGAAESITLSVSGLPAGVTASFSPATVTAGASSTLTLTVPLGASGANNQAFTVTGAAPSMTRTASATVTIPSDFSIALSPTSRTITSGTSTTYTVTTAVTSGGAETINLVAFNLPAGVSASFSPAQVSAGGTSTLTLTSATGTPGGTSNFTVQGSSPSATHNATAQLVVLNDFSLTVTPANRSVASGGTVTYTVTTARTSGTAQQVALSVSGLPSGVTGTFSPATVNTGGSSTLTITAQGSAPGATATLTVTGTSPSATRTANAQLTVRNDFSLSLSPSSRSVTAGGSVTYSVVTAVTSGSAEEVALSLSGLPSGVTGSFSPATVSAGGTATLTLSADLSAAGGNTPFTVTGTAPSATRTANGALTVVNDFGLAVSPASQSVRSGDSASYTVTTRRASGNAEPITLSVGGLPLGVTATFSPATVSAGATSVLTLTAAQSAPGASATFTVTGTSASARHTASATVHVVNDFDLTVSPASATVTSGSSTSLLVTTARTSGTAEQVALSVSGLPTGVTATFTPATVTAGGTSTLTLTAAADAPGANAQLTVIGAASSSTRSAQAQLTLPNAFSLALSPASGAVRSGGTVTFTVATARTSGTPEPVALSIAGLPTGVTGSFNPATVTAGGTSTLTLSADPSAAGASATFTVTGAAASGSQSASGQLTVENDFTLAVTPANQPIVAGGTATFTVATGLASGSAEPVSLSVTGLPAGITGAFSPTSVTAGGSATLTLTATQASVPGGTFAFGVTGASASATHSAQASVTVRNDFALTVTPPSRVVNSGTTTTFTLATTATSGDAEAVTLSVSGLPAGVTGAISPATVTAGGSATLTLTIDASAQGGTTAFTIVAVSASASHPAQASLTIANDFALQVAPSSRSLTSGGTATYTVTTTATSGTAEAVTLSLSGLPSGITASFSPATVTAGGTATLTLTAAQASLPGGSFTFTVTGAAPSRTHTAEATVAVVNEFSLAVTPSSRSISASTPGIYTVGTVATSGTPEEVTLSVAGLPAGVTGVFSPATVTAGGTATLTLTANAGAAGGTRTFTVTGTAASGGHSAEASVTVLNDFSLSASPASQVILSGSGTSFTVTTFTTSGSAEPVALSVSGLPSGVTAQFSPGMVTSGGTATLTLLADASAPGGIAVLTLTGTSPSATHTAQAGLTVANDFSLAVSPVARSVRSGGSVSYTVTTARASGSAESITLGITGLPSGLTARFDPAVVNAGGSSTLTLTAANGTPGGTTAFSVTGTSASATHPAGGSVTVVNDFGLAVLPATAEVRGGGSVSYAVRTTVESGSAEPIVLSVSGLPAGITAQFEPATVNAGGSATLTLSAVTGISTGGGFSVTGTSASATHAAQAMVTVGNGFALTTDRPGMRLTAGGTATLTVNTSVTSGQTEAITLSISGLPAGVTAQFTPAMVNAGGSATLTLTGAANLPAQPGRTLVLTGTSASATATVNVGLVTLTAPTVSILTPASGATVSGTVPVTANALVSAGATLEKIELYAGDTLIGTSTGITSQFTVAWNTAPLANGPYDLRAKVYDADGNTAVSPVVPVMVRNRKPPTAAISSPTDGTTVRGTLTLEATATANGGAQLSKVEVYVDTILIGSSTSSPASFPWDSSLVKNGAHVITAKAYDSEGEMVTSAAVNITVDNARCGCAADGGSLGLGGLLALLTVARRLGARRRREART